jgi:hypothetical protein
MLFAQTPTLYTTQTTTASSGIPAIFWVIYIAFIVLFILANWKIFTKADEAGWKSLIPFYNTYITLVIAGLPGWYLILLLIPFVNIIIAILLSYKLAKAFGYGIGMTILELLIVGYLIIAFGKAKYLGPDGGASSDKPAPSPTPVAPPAAPAA